MKKKRQDEIAVSLKFALTDEEFTLTLPSPLKGEGKRKAMTEGNKIGEIFFEIFVAIGREVG